MRSGCKAALRQLATDVTQVRKGLFLELLSRCCLLCQVSCSTVNILTVTASMLSKNKLAQLTGSYLITWSKRSFPFSVTN